MRLFLLLLLSISFTCAHFELVVGLKKRNLAELERLFWKVSDPRSEEYLRFRTVSELSGLVGAEQGAIDGVREWLVSLGAESTTVSPLHDIVYAHFPPSVSAALPSSHWSRKGFPLRNSSSVYSSVDYVMRRDDRPPSFTTAPLPKSPERSKQTKPSNQVTSSSEGTVDNQKKAYGVPVSLTASNKSTVQMVWGPGTFGYSARDLGLFRDHYAPKLDLKKITCNSKADCANHGDNFGEGSLDTEYISSMGLGVRTEALNTNMSSSTEEGEGFGQALLDFIVTLSQKQDVPHVLSLSLGSLGAYSCDLLCSEAAKTGTPLKACREYLQKQRQVCMFLSQEQTLAINNAFQVLGLRGVTIFGSSGDGGSHFSFGPFESGELAGKLNKIACQFQLPVFPTASPYIVSVGGTAWTEDGDGGQSNPIAWSGSGGGFSWMFDQPQHQAEAVGNYLKSTSGLPPSSSFNASGRGYPDISSLADIVIPLCLNGGCRDSGGTSASCPATAGLFSLIVDHRLNKGLPPLGFLAPRLWKVASQYPGEAFQDITQGNSQTSCDNGFPATSGWDPVTGWGRPVWDGMLKYFGSD